MLQCVALLSTLCIRTNTDPIFFFRITTCNLLMFFSLGCTLCNCNSIGSVNSICNTSTAFCTCKQNAEGLSCGRCKSGFYGYSRNYAHACLKCQCSGKTRQCATASGFYPALINTTLSTLENNILIDGWRSVNANDFESGTLNLDWTPLYAFLR